MRALDLVLFAIGENFLKVRDIHASFFVDLNCNLKLETDSTSVLSEEDPRLKFFLILSSLAHRFLFC